MYGSHVSWNSTRQVLINFEGLAEKQTFISWRAFGQVFSVIIKMNNSSKISGEAGIANKGRIFLDVENGPPEYNPAQPSSKAMPPLSR